MPESVSLYAVKMNDGFAHHAGKNFAFTMPITQIADIPGVKRSENSSV